MFKVEISNKFDLRCEIYDFYLVTNLLIDFAIY